MFRHLEQQVHRHKARKKLEGLQDIKWSRKGLNGLCVCL